MTPRIDLVERTCHPLYGRHKGRPLSPARKKALATLQRELALTLPPQEKKLNLAALFAAPVENVCLEIGFGGGEHLLHFLTHNPATGVLASEIWQPGLAKLAAHLARPPQKNAAKRVRVFTDDGAALLPFLPSASLRAIFLLFPDPWPKRAHRRRRFIQQESLIEMARVLKPEGIFFTATDNRAVSAQILGEIARQPETWRWQAESASTLTPALWRKPWPGYAPTRYDMKARRQGRRPVYLAFARR